MYFRKRINGLSVNEFQDKIIELQTEHTGVQIEEITVSNGDKISYEGHGYIIFEEDNDRISIGFDNDKTYINIPYSNDITIDLVYNESVKSEHRKGIFDISVHGCHILSLDEFRNLSNVKGDICSIEVIIDTKNAEEWENNYKYKLPTLDYEEIIEFTDKALITNNRNEFIPYDCIKWFILEIDYGRIN